MNYSYFPNISCLSGAILVEISSKKKIRGGRSQSFVFRTSLEEWNRRIHRLFLLFLAFQLSSHLLSLPLVDIILLSLNAGHKMILHLFWYRWCVWRVLVHTHTHTYARLITSTHADKYIRKYL